MKTISFFKQDNELCLSYFPEQEINFVAEKLQGGIFKLKNALYLTNTNLLAKLDYENNHCQFIIAKLVDNYFKFDKEILSIDVDLYIHQNISIDIHFFVAKRNISIFKHINKIINEDVYIGFDEQSNLPYIEFQKLLKEFPTSYELDKYSNSRIALILRDYISLKEDSANAYERYMNKKITFHGNFISDMFKQSEKEKYSIILKKLSYMLEHDKKYSEKQWQIEIKEMILLIYPKYINIYDEVAIKNIYSGTHKRTDFMLVSYTGHIDIIEIKKSTINLMRTTDYRGNYIPSFELSGTIMQVEKYIYFLNKWSKKGEETLTTKFKSSLPIDLKLKITNPQAIIIMGRNNFKSKDEENDFEIIKRKYKSILDIITYDDLVKRLERLIQKFT